MSEFYYSKKNKNNFFFTIVEFVLLFAFSYFVILPCFIHFSGIETYLLYKPVKEYQKVLPQLEKKYAEIKIKTKDKNTIFGWSFKAQKKQPTILIFCPSKGNLSEYQNIVNFLVSKGYGVFIADYRGYGKSTGKPSQQKLYEDSNAIYDYLTQTLKLKDNEIILYGQSLGGSIALNLSAAKKVKALILQNSFPSIRDILIEMTKTAKLSKYPQVKEINIKFFEYLPIWQNFDNKSAITKINNNNILILNSTKEKEIPLVVSNLVKNNLKTAELYNYTPKNDADIDSFSKKLLLFLQYGVR